MGETSRDTIDLERLARALKDKRDVNGRRVLLRTVEDIRKAAAGQLEAGNDWWEFHQHGLS